MDGNNIECTLCKSRDTEKIDSTIRNADNSIYSMYRCKCCETHFLYPGREEKELEHYYDGEFREAVHSKAYYEKNVLDRVFERFLFEARERVTRVEKELSKEDTILEIGCSVGYFMSAAAPFVGKVYGTEWDRKAAQYVRDRFPEFSVSEEPEDFGICFDKIFLFHVLEHVCDPIAFITRLKKLLRPGGTIYIEVPNADDVLIKTYACKEFMAHYYKLAHLYNFNETGIKYIMDRTNLSGEIEYVQRYDLSDHMVWLRDGLPGGNGRFCQVLNSEVNNAYVNALKRLKQTDTMLIRLRQQNGVSHTF